MLVQHNATVTRSIGEMLLQSGINKIDDELWEATRKAPQWQRKIKNMIESGTIKPLDPKKKLTVAMVKETFEITLLREWETNPDYKGPLKSAIRSQIEAVDLVEKEDI